MPTSVETAFLIARTVTVIGAEFSAHPSSTTAAWAHAWFCYKKVQGGVKIISSAFINELF